MGRYTTFLDRNPEDVQGQMFEGLNSAISGAGNIALQKKMRDIQRQQELQDTIKKAIVSSQLKNMRLKQGGDINRTISPEGNLDLSQFERYNPLEALLGGGNQIPEASTSPKLGGFKMKGVTTDEEGNLKYNLEPVQTEEEVQKDIERKTRETQAQELAKGIPTSETGKVALARESIKNIQDIKKMLFPTGKADSFKRSTAFASNLPGGSLPILPSRGWGKAEQEVYRKMGAALSGRQLIQTGVAARPEETQKLVSQFAPSGGSNPEAALTGLDELENFYKDYLSTLETRGIKNTFTGKSMQSQQQYQVGQTISRGGKDYQVTGFDTDGEPLVDLVR